ncbi:hypothetical protein [Actinomadura rupiterrae]|uniref:hypothetical protein n=1 Tax=Actinomadura rupiterrae TaxID=559627 RepID=UPI0020A29F80|nr:hypothetical protein [Actinomadura rupiterrae]MCP2334805.1 hypothetical protein [Actinomadura rupiterrae]
MPLAKITLASGRLIALDDLRISTTYGGLLEGYPNPGMNDRLLAHLAKRRESPYQTSPVHLIDPPRRRRDESSTRRMPFGPFEELPALYCRGSFTSDRIDETLEKVLHRSWLEVVWFQDDLTVPVADFVTAAVADLPWNTLAEDHEL